MPKLAKTSQNTELKWHPEVPYDELPPLPPPFELETKKILKKCIPARTALAALKQAAMRIPNQSMLINTVPLLEAQASSEIENIVTTSDRLFQFRETDTNADAATKEALRYSRALLDGFNTLKKRPLNTGTAEDVCSKIKGVEMKVRKVPGTALANAKKKIIYTPPEGEDNLRNLLSNWENFLHEETEIDPLIRMAVGHYQFEAIHPFTDGNGRTGRVLNSLFLIQEDLLNLPILYLSRFIIQNKTQYYRLILQTTTEHKWEDWIVFILEGVEQTAIWTTSKIESIQALLTHTADFVRNKRSKIYSFELINVLFEQPYCRIHNLVDSGIVERQAASRYLKEMVKLGVLKEQKSGREKIFVHTKLLKLLTEDSNDFVEYE